MVALSFCTDPSLRLDRYACYRASIYGQLGVQLFFVISGFCIASAAVRASERSNGTLSFVQARLRRIYPPYFIATFFAIGISMLAGFLVKHHLIAQSALSHSSPLHHSLKYFLASALLLQVRVPRQALLDRYAHVISDGVYSRALEHANVVAARGWTAGVGALIQPQIPCRGRLRNSVARGGLHVGNVKRPMNRVVGNLQEERIIRVAIDKAYRASCDLVGEVARNVDWCRILVEIRCPITHLVCVITDRTAHKTEEFVKAMCIRTEFRFEAKMPFANEPSRVAILLQERW